MDHPPRGLARSQGSLCGHESARSAECCLPAPAGSRVRSGRKSDRTLGRQDGQGYEWPDSNHGITVDYKGNVWIGGNGAAPQLPAAAEDAGGARAAAAALRRRQDEAQTGPVPSVLTTTA